MSLQVKVVHQAIFLGRENQLSVVNVETWVITGKDARVKVVQVKLVVLVNRVKEQEKLLVQGISLVKLLVHVNLVQHQAKQSKDQVNIVQDQLKQ
ncbi:hypothetical protein Tco_0234975, partial [Tanacetum coccineum]